VVVRRRLDTARSTPRPRPDRNGGSARSFGTESGAPRPAVGRTARPPRDAWPHRRGRAIPSPLSSSPCRTNGHRPRPGGQTLERRLAERPLSVLALGSARSRCVTSSRWLGTYLVHGGPTGHLFGERRRPGNAMFPGLPNGGEPDELPNCSTPRRGGSSLYARRRSLTTPRASWLGALGPGGDRSPSG
jgi:hypothetical protein